MRARMLQKVERDNAHLAKMEAKSSACKMRMDLIHSGDLKASQVTEPCKAVKPPGIGVIMMIARKLEIQGKVLKVQLC